jgi:hypothetical protein
MFLEYRQAVDLFGNKIPEPTWEERYEAYLQTPAWKSRREEKLYKAGYKCEKCGRQGKYARLEVHHLHYKTLGHESLYDLQVLCKSCHKRADELREYEIESNFLVQRAHCQSEWGPFNRWATARWGRNWHFDYDIYGIVRCFEMYEREAKSLARSQALVGCA